jgi:dimethylargininase
MLDRRALVRRPSSQLAKGIVTHIERQPVDVDLALRQWESYVAALENAGWEIIQVPPMEECPDGVFIEDDVVMYGDRAVVARPGADERKPETAAIADLLGALGYDVVSIEAPGTLDGGDILKHDNTVWVGLGGRTNQSGLDQLTAYLEPYGARVVPVPLSKVLHLKSAVTALPDGSIIGYPPLVDDPAFFPHFRPMPEEAGAHVVDLGEGRLLIAASAPRSADLIADLGYTPVPVDITEFEKMEGCVTCLSVRLRTPPRAD